MTERRPIDRRTFLGAAGAVPLAVPAVRTLAADPPLEVSTNTYPWGTFAARDGRAFQPRADETLDAIAAAGLTGYEPALTDVAELDGLGPRLQARGLRMPSLYASSTCTTRRWRRPVSRTSCASRAARQRWAPGLSSPTRRRSAGADRRTRPTPRFAHRRRPWIGLVARCAPSA